MKFNDNNISIFNGKKLNIEIFGASHAPEIGVKIDGLNGKKISFECVKNLLDRRRAKKQVFSTKRLEADEFIVTDGYSDGEIKNGFRAVIKNQAQRSTDYEKTVKIPRPSHADFVAWEKYGDGYDYRGGGKFSGRMTAPMCIAGGICKETAIVAHDFNVTYSSDNSFH